jgi:hypothetical protein
LRCPGSNRDPVAERIQEIVFALVVLVADPEIFDLFYKMVPSFAFVDDGLVERMVRVLDLSSVDIARNRNRALVLAHRRQRRFDRTSWPLSAYGLSPGREETLPGWRDRRDGP